MYANVNFRGPQDAAWAPADFLGHGNREKRQWSSIRDRWAVMKENAKLAMMRPGQEPDDLPDWARGAYQGKAAS